MPLPMRTRFITTDDIYALLMESGQSLIDGQII